MSDTLSLLPEQGDDSPVLWKSVLVALLFEAIVLTGVGWRGHWLAHPQKAAGDTSNFIEAQIYERPEVAHLVEEAKPIAAPVKHEATLSKVPDKGHQAKPEESKLTEENQTDAGTKLAPTHGPVAILSPPPTIPSYLQDKDLHASVVIDFFVSSQGITTPRLVGSSGNEELDAIAIASAKKWLFRPGEKDHHPIDSKVRLRIVFEVK